MLLKSSSESTFIIPLCERLFNQLPSFYGTWGSCLVIFRLIKKLQHVILSHASKKSGANKPTTFPYMKPSNCISVPLSCFGVLGFDITLKLPLSVSKPVCSADQAGQWGPDAAHRDTLSFALHPWLRKETGNYAFSLGVSPGRAAFCFFPVLSSALSWLKCLKSWGLPCVPGEAILV